MCVSVCVCCISSLVTSLDRVFERELENSAFLEVYFGLDSSCWFDTLLSNETLSPLAVFLILFICTSQFHVTTFGEYND